jgi:hypothetical protein
MKSPSTAHLEMVRKLLAHEVHSAPDPAEAAARLYEKLLLHLSPLIGSIGVQALIARSMQLTKAEHPCFEKFTAPLQWTQEPEDLGDHLRDCLREQALSVAREAAEDLFSGFFSLLATFIGARLTAQVLHGVWPESPEPGPHERKR